MAFPFPIFVSQPAGDSGAPYTPGVAVSSTNTYYSKPWGASDADGHGLHMQWTGTPTGTLTMWMSDKPFPSEVDDADWVQDTTWSPTNPAGSASKARDDAGNAKAYRKRLKYVNASGSGVLYGWVSVPGMR